MAIMIPLPGSTVTSQPAMAAIRPAHAPEALTTKSASIRTSSPPRRSLTRAPRTAPPSTVRSRTS